MSIKSLVAKAALFFSAPLLIAPAAIAEDRAWADISPATGHVQFGFQSGSSGGNMQFQPGPNIVPEPYFYPQGPQMPYMQGPGMAGGMSSVPGMGGMGGQQSGRYPKPKLPDCRYATMANSVNIGAEANPNAPYFSGGSIEDEVSGSLSDGGRPVSIEDGVMNGGQYDNLPDQRMM